MERERKLKTETFPLSQKVKREIERQTGKNKASEKEKNQIQCFLPVLLLTDLSTCL